MEEPEQGQRDGQRDGIWVLVNSFNSLQLVAGLRLVPDPEGGGVVLSGRGRGRPPVWLPGATPALLEALFRLRAGGVTDTSLSSSVLISEGPAGLRTLRTWLGLLDAFGAIERTLVVDGSLVATLRPSAAAVTGARPRFDSEQPYVLSRFGCLRNDRGRLVLETPLGHGVLTIHAEMATAALFRLARPLTAASLGASVPGLDGHAAGLLLDLLLRARAVVPSPNGAPAPEDDDPALGRWTFHDLLFHSRHRLGRHADPYGASPIHARRFAPLPLRKAPPSGVVVPLERPDIDALAATDAPFSRVLEARASLRQPGEPPITLRQLGEFLFRSARVKSADERHGVSLRPAPSGGALQALEIYPIAVRCAGLDAGLYHYDPFEHVLRRLESPEWPLAMLVDDARGSAGLDTLPQVVLVIAARFQRMQHKYQSVAYSLILKDVGCLMQTMYLVATAMGLAPCALGGGHSDLFAQAASLDYYQETSVGEFILSSRSEEEVLGVLNGEKPSTSD
jgi:oxazoline/thiazoline dehydrogenase